MRQSALSGPLSIAPLPRAQVGQVAHLQLPPAQRGFVGLIEEMTEDPEGQVDFHVIRKGQEAVGFFKVDRDFSRKDNRLNPGAHGLRGLLIGGQYQRLGIGAAALAALPAYLARHYPKADTIYLLVDQDNAPAIRAYRAHGWADCDLPARPGRSGPEQVMSLPLNT